MLIVNRIHKFRSNRDLKVGSVFFFSICIHKTTYLTGGIVCCPFHIIICNHIACVLYSVRVVVTTLYTYTVYLLSHFITPITTDHVRWIDGAKTADEYLTGDNRRFT